MKLLIVAGGGGHFSPALAVIEDLPKDTELLVVGRKYALEGDSALSLEYQTLTSGNVAFKVITTGRLQRRFTKHTLFSLLKIPLGILQSFKILAAYKPEVVLSFGGYVAFPVTLAAWVLNVPVVLHEQTLSLGLANKIASLWAKKVCISWESSRKFFPKEKTVLTGNPVKKYQISNIKYPFGPSSGRGQISNEKLPLVLITGGSAGSHALNSLVEGCLEQLLGSYRVIHQTGDAREFGDFDMLEDLKKTFPEDLQKRYVLTKFISPSEFAAVVSHADVVVCRCGINTLSEILHFKKMCVLIPLPFGKNREQEKNARFVKDLGIGEILFQDKATSMDMLSLLQFMIENRAGYEKAAGKLEEIVKPNAVQAILKVVQSVLQNNDEDKKRV